MTHYTKANLVEDLAELDLIFSTKKAAKDTVEFIFAKVIEQVAAGNQVDLSGLCSFKPAIQAARSGTVPGTTKTYESPEKKIVKITPASVFKAAVAA